MVDLYPQAFSWAYTYANGYIKADTMKIGVGYWVKFDTAVAVKPPVGTPIVSDTITVHRGWNLIGGAGDTVVYASITQIPPGIEALGYFYKFSNGYIANAFLAPGLGYWMKAAAAGQLILHPGHVAGQMAEGGPAHKEESFERFNSITIADQQKGRQVLYFGAADSTLAHGDYELPPVPPEGLFDARFQSQQMVENIRTGAGTDLTILLQSSSYPVTLEFGVTHPQVKTITVFNAVTKKQLGVWSRTNPSIIQIADRSINKLLLTITTGSPVIPHEYALAQNYPNPFNPSTNLQFDLPVKSKVTLRLFNTLGQEVRKILDAKEYEAGRYNVLLDLTNYAAGVYFYEISATSLEGKSVNFRQARKLVLVK
jgi:hypothetical protein